MKYSKAWVAQRLSIAKQVFRQGLVTCRETEGALVEPQNKPVLVYVKPPTLKGYVSMVLAKRIKAKLRHSMIPVELSGNWSRKANKEWDLKGWYRVTELKQHFLEDIPWGQVDSVRRKRQRLDEGYFVSDTRTHELLDRRLESHDKLFETIKRDGGLSTAPEHLVQLNISDNGELYWGPNGQHRIAMAVVLDLAFIPMKLGYVHTKGTWALASLLEKNEKELFD